MAKWDLSKLPEGRSPIPDEWFKKEAAMQDRIDKLEAKLLYAEDFALRLERFAEEAGDKFILTKARELLSELGGKK